MSSESGQPNAESVPLVGLQPAPWNPRSIRDERFQNLCRSLEADPDFLQLRPILATADGTIFAGNMRYRAAQHLGWETISAVLVEIPEQLARERALRDNAQWGEWLEEDLVSLLAELGAAGSELELLGLPVTGHAHDAHLHGLQPQEPGPRAWPGLSVDAHEGDDAARADTDTRLLGRAPAPAA